MKAVFLIIDFVPHQVLSIKSFLEASDTMALVFHVDKFRVVVPELGMSCQSIHIKTFTKAEILAKIIDFHPDVIVTAGWMISEYNWICRQIKSVTDIPILAMSDTPWYGTWKQRFHTFIAPFHTKKSFTHIWVAGIRQYDYARKLGFSNEQIIFNSLSANIEIFNSVNIETKRSNYPKNFLYIGRFVKVKGLHNLMKAWTAINNKKGWTFTLIGEGELKEELYHNGSFIVKDYMEQKSLLEEMQNAGCFVLPSLREPWAIVIHEAVGAGLPIICTDTCGAAPHFVINQYNGFRIKNNSISDLKEKLEFIINQSTCEHIRMSRNSRNISQRITPRIHTASLLQVIKK